ncbi:helix-turn-helix domain-containing protein [Thiomicrorhabdus chilensis]|uniref:helix-turn-helix domain-containing protein n=1 Tax=Thiomicrorhabdus chilensis TaxID=63656 RepID=UPI000401689E|nr:helix-turn-helix transcriptional regulator [Thiomicrorhabdus chilensis]
MISFNEYIKCCRQKLGLTQTRIVEELIKHNASFTGLDITTYSRWERGVTTPKYQRKKSILSYFFSRTLTFYPYIDFENNSNLHQSAQRLPLPNSLHNHLLVMNLPMCHFPDKQIESIPIQESNQSSLATSFNHLIIKALYDFNINTIRHKHLISNPGNFSMVCLFNDNYMGHLFCLKIKTSVYHKLIRFKMSVSELNTEHLADDSEDGGLLFFGLFSLSNEVLKNLWAQLYNWLAINQKKIQFIGAITSDKESFHTLLELEIEHIGTTKRKTKIYHSLSSPLKKVMLSEPVINTMFYPVKN